MVNFIRFLFFLLLIKPLALIIIGLNIRNRPNIPMQGPAVLVANHNSHLDTMILMALFPIRMIHQIYPVAAADHFLKSKVASWFFLKIIGIIPIDRSSKPKITKKDPFVEVSKKLDAGNIIIVYPEGTRGEPEIMSVLKKGIAHLAKKHRDVPIVPFFLHGLGKAFPRGTSMLVPFVCDIYVGQPLYWNGDIDTFMKSLETSLQELKSQHHLS